VAVTQQFNTTTSMGRLTLNVLLSFAQFERELASERVRDKVAASRKKGKWTGGTVPLGYDAKDKKLVINKAEAETVRTIFRLYLELKSFGKLLAELDRRKIVTKRRATKVAKYQGGIPFTYGPLAYLLKNRIYIGEMHHGGKWFDGEHVPILDRETFQRVQDTLKSNRIACRIKHSESGALLQGKLFDDKGNRMGPSFSGKNGSAIGSMSAPPCAVESTRPARWHGYPRARLAERFGCWAILLHRTVGSRLQATRESRAPRTATGISCARSNIGHPGWRAVAPAEADPENSAPDLERAATPRLAFVYRMLWSTPVPDN
jgi:hypothetical protein